MFPEIMEQAKEKKNFVFIGGAGSGKSEIAINFANYLRSGTNRAVHFFDMDMTKSLYRSRDVIHIMEAMGIQVHYEEQFADAPTAVGGVWAKLKSSADYVVMDIGGDSIGARAIGAYARGLNADDTVVYYVLNAFRPWSADIDQIDRTLGEILGVSHIELERIHILDNPNTGPGTTKREFCEGSARTRELITPYKKIDFACVREEMYKEVKDECPVPLMPLHLYLTYEWATAV